MRCGGGGGGLAEGFDGGGGGTTSKRDSVAGSSIIEGDGLPSENGGAPPIWAPSAAISSAVSNEGSGSEVS